MSRLKRFLKNESTQSTESTRESSESTFIPTLHRPIGILILKSN